VLHILIIGIGLSKKYPYKKLAWLQRLPNISDVANIKDFGLLTKHGAKLFLNGTTKIE
jgi:hypothetical protein